MSFACSADPGTDPGKTQGPDRRAGADPSPVTTIAWRIWHLIGSTFADADKAGFALHILDEAIHHAAEVALMRDLWQARLGRTDIQPSSSTGAG